MTDNSQAERHVLDATERRMVELLQHDGRLPVAWLAKELSVTEVTARRKLRGLLARGIIRIVATVDPSLTCATGRRYAAASSTTSSTVRARNHGSIAA